MAQVDLRGNIILDGQTTSGFDGLAQKVRAMAQVLGQVGDEIWDFERDSLDIYKDYETNMLQARAAMSSTYDSTSELDKVMETLGQHVQDWAANSIFHVKDFSGAVNNAAHAGWDLEQQLEGIPRAMLLAQAGGLDLSDGLEYLARALNVTGTDFKDSGTLVDQWVKASHLANLTIEDLGDSLNRMGVTAQLTDSTAELFTMLDALANTGSVGSEAGTLLRGTIMRLIAPTKKASEAMEQLQVTQEEYNDLAGDAEALSKANKLLEAQGFSAYDTNGQLKPLMQTYGELYDALVKIAGSEEDLLTNSEVDEILAAIFPQRQISGALSFLQAVKGGWEDLYEAIKNSEGTAQADADIMMSGLMGSEELFKSKWEEFQRKVGEELSGPFEDVLGFLSGVVDSLNALPTEVLDGLLGGLTGIAALGSALGVGSGVFKFFSMLGPWGTAAVVAAFGIGALASYLTKMSEIQFESKFGDMAVDIDKLKESLVNFETPGDEGRRAVDEWTDSVNEIAEAYSGLAESFAKELKLDTLTNAELKPEDIASLQKLGASIQGEVLKGISMAADRDQVAVNTLFGLKSNEDYDNLSAEDKALYDALSQGFSDYYSELETEAYQIGENIRQQLTAALQNGEITPEDEAAIKAQLDRYNQIMAEIADAQRQEDLAVLMEKSQRISWDSFQGWMDDLEQQHAAAIEERQSHWDREAARYEVLHNKGLIEDDEYQAAIDRINGNKEKGIVGERQADIDETDRYFGDLVTRSVDSTMYDSEWSDVWKFLRQDQKDNVVFDENGRVNYDNLDFSTMDTATLKDLGEQVADLDNYSRKLIGEMSEFSGYEGVQDRIELLDSLEFLQQYIDSELSGRKYQDEEILGGVDEYGRVNIDRIGELTEENTARVLQDLASQLNGYGLDGNEREADLYEQAYRHAIDDLHMSEAELPTYERRGEYLEQQAETTLPENVQQQRDTVAEAMALVAKNQGLMDANRADYENADSGWNRLWDNVDTIRQGKDNEYYGYTDPFGDYHMGLVDYQQNAQTQLSQAVAEFGAMLGQLHIESGPLQAPAQGSYLPQQLADQGVSVKVDGDTTELAATIEAEEGQTLMQYVSGDATDLHMSIFDEDGQTLRENVTGDASQLASVINSYNGKTVTIFLKGQRLFAEGGRATEASIFGEAGPEWAIPEEHSDRTAQLLNAAREASGFTWDDLVSRYGGLNADANHVNVNLNYSPTINAANAEGVEAALEKDKARIEKLVQEAVKRAMDSAKLHDDVEVYA